MENVCHKSNKWVIQSVCLNTNITSVKFISELLFVGEGNKVHCYNWKTKILLHTEVIFRGSSVHGIKILEKEDAKIRLLLFGGKAIRIYDFCTCENKFSALCSEHEMEDWIHDAGHLHVDSSNSDKHIVAFVLAHNSVILWDWKKCQVLKKYQCSERCILYSAKILQCVSSAIIVAVGTVFQEIVIWSPNSSNPDSPKIPLHRLQGHQGVIFSISYNSSLNLLATTSDDRSLRIWKFSSVVENGKNCSLKYWTEGSFTQVHTLFGHESRVWMAVILKSCIISVGEDSNICFWKHDGCLIRKEKCHKNGSIWCLDVDSEISIAVTGGSDSSILLWDINQILGSNDSLQRIENFNLSEGDFPRNISLLFVHSLYIAIITTDQGKIFSYNFKLKRWDFIFYETSYASYAVMAISHHNDQFLLGNISGDICLFNILVSGCCSEIKLSHRWKICSEKINNIHWVHKDSGTVLVCNLNGNMAFYDIVKADENYEFVLKNQLHLPKSKLHWWSTKALLVKDNDCLIVGDRSGNIHIYSKVSVVFEGKLCKRPDTTFSAIHGKNGVTDVKHFQNNIYTCGRDGRVLLFDILLDEIRLLHCIKAPYNMEWIGRLLFYENDLIILGFHTTEFMVWSTKHEKYIMKVNCGGGHRSWDFAMNNIEDGMFVAIRKKEIFFAAENLKFMLSASVIQAGISGMQLRCVCYLFTRTDSEYGEIHVLACGGEDPSLKIIGLHRELKKKQNCTVLRSIHAHLSSIKAIAKCRMINKDSFLMVTVGGRAQMVIWQVLNGRELCCEELHCHFLWSVDKPHRKPWKEKNAPVFDPQTRYMDVTVWSYPSTCDNYENVSNEVYFIGTACSDSFIRIYNFTFVTRELTEIICFQQGNFCVLRMAALLADKEAVNKKCILTAANDGYVKLHELAIVPPSCPSLQHNDVVKLLYQFHCHQSGVNALDVKCLSENLWLMCSVGDDNALAVNIFSIKENKDSSIFLVAEGLAKNAHASQITGVKILSKEIIVSVSIDQRINLWNLMTKNCVVQLNMLESKMCLIPDVSHMEMWFSEKNNVWSAIVCGEGIECFQISAFAENLR